MGVFSSIMDKIFHRKAAPSVQAAPAPVPGAGAGQGAAPAPTPAPPPPVDVEAVLEALAQAKGGGGNWRISIVDLLKLLDLDSSLTARKELAEELDVHAGEHGSAEQNIALQKAVWKALEQNGGKVPPALRD